ncbi:MAG: SAM-dependent methyltransferase [Micropepsaceae bacterium]
MTDVASFLKSIILNGGPIPVSEFARLALSGRPDSYYLRHDPLGSGGDFVTAPELSQVFGECVGIWCIDLWVKLGSPSRLRLVELGPGRGTLMSDVLRTARIRPAFLNALAISLVDINPVLRKQQMDLLSSMAPASIEWHRQFEDIELDSPTIIIANEFFDALPARQFVRTEFGWSERVVGLGPDGELAFGAAATSDFTHMISPALRHAQPGTIHEFCPYGANLADTIGKALEAQRGGVLVIDYGYQGPATGDTLQALKSHAFSDVLKDIGNSDMTFHVDFEVLSRTLRRSGVNVCPLVEQGAFLKALGAAERTRELQRRASPAQCQQLENALHRLTSTETMGTLFKVLCAVAPPTIVPLGVQTA